MIHRGGEGGGRVVSSGNFSLPFAFDPAVDGVN